MFVEDNILPKVLNILKITQITQILQILSEIDILPWDNKGVHTEQGRAWIWFKITESFHNLENLLKFKFHILKIMRRSTRVRGCYYWTSIYKVTYRGG